MIFWDTEVFPEPELPATPMMYGSVQGGIYAGRSSKAGESSGAGELKKEALLPFSGAILELLLCILAFQEAMTELYSRLILSLSSHLIMRS